MKKTFTIVFLFLCLACFSQEPLPQHLIDTLSFNDGSVQYHKPIFIVTGDNVVHYGCDSTIGNLDYDFYKRIINKDAEEEQELIKDLPRKRFVDSICVYYSYLLDSIFRVAYQKNIFIGLHITEYQNYINNYQIKDLADELFRKHITKKQFDQLIEIKKQVCLLMITMYVKEEE